MRLFAARISLAASMVIAVAPAASAASYQVQMLNKDSRGETWQFEPAFLKVAPGDTVTFVPADKGHNSETLDGIVPEGAAPWKGSFNQPITVTYTAEGIYIYKCLPHAPLGMVGVIQVGDSASNLDAVSGANFPGKAKTRIAELISQAVQ